MRTLILFILLLKLGHAQSLIPEAVKVKTAFEKLSADIYVKKSQENYIAAFPSDTKTFLRVFQTEKFDQLYSGSEKYINALEKCAETFPTEVISKCVDIGKNLVWDADAVGELQHMSVNIAIKHLTIFITKYKSLNSVEQDSLINFYADVENHKAYHEYQKLIDELSSVGEKEIASKLEAARTLRKQRKDH